MNLHRERFFGNRLHVIVDRLQVERQRFFRPKYEWIEDVKTRFQEFDEATQSFLRNDRVLLDDDAAHSLILL